MVDEPHQWAKVWARLSTICAATALLRLRHFLLRLLRYPAQLEEGNERWRGSAAVQRRSSL